MKRIIIVILTLILCSYTSLAMQDIPVINFNSSRATTRLANSNPIAYLNMNNYFLMNNTFNQTIFSTNFCYLNGTCLGQSGMAESDPVWLLEKTNYYTIIDIDASIAGNISYHEANFKHGNTTDEIFNSVDNNSFYPYSSNPSGYLTSYTESDPYYNRSWNQTKGDELYYPLNSNPHQYINTTQDLFPYATDSDVTKNISLHETTFKHGNTTEEILNAANASGLIKDWSNEIGTGLGESLWKNTSSYAYLNNTIPQAINTTKLCLNNIDCSNYQLITRNDTGVYMSWY